MSVSNRISSIQYLRGIAALGVVLCHYGSAMQSYPLISDILNKGQYGVHVFFLISGFIIVYSLDKSGYKPSRFFNFLIKRSVRIDPPYIATILLIFLLFKLLSYQPAFKGNAIPFVPGQFIAHLLYLVPFTKYPFYNHIFWTLCVEFQFYVLIGLLFYLSERKIYKHAFLLMFSLTCFIPFDNSFYLVFNYAPIFSLGISTLYFYRDRNWLNAVLPGALLILIVLKFGLLIFALLLFSVAIILLTNTNLKLLYCLGQVSYSLYLTHTLSYILIAGALKRAGANLQTYQLCWLVLEVSAAIGLAYIFYLLVERPSWRLSKRVFYFANSFV